MPNYNISNTPRSRGVVTTMFNSAATGTGTAVTLDSAAAMVLPLKTANTSTFSFKLQGSIDGTFYVDIGSAITTIVGTSITTPWQYLRAEVTAIGNTAKTASSVTQAGGIATFNCASHGFLVGEYVTVSGANEAGYNVSAVILTKDTNSFTYAVASGTATPATGTVVANGNLRIFCAE